MTLAERGLKHSAVHFGSTDSRIIECAGWKKGATVDVLCEPMAVLICIGRHREILTTSCPELLKGIHL